MENSEPRRRGRPKGAKDTAPRKRGGSKPELITRATLKDLIVAAAKPVEPDPAPTTQKVKVPDDIDPRQFLSMVMLGKVSANTNQMKAAVELAKLGVKGAAGGIKSQRNEAAQTAAKGKFAPRAAPPGAH